MEENDKYEPAVSGNGGEVPPVNEIQALKEERDGLYDRLLRKQAEFDNYKKRIDRERSEYVQFASAELMKELLNVLDSFDRALQNTGGNIGGFELIYKQLQDTMGRFGLKAIEAKGQTFDPNIHQAVATQPTDEVEENTVVEEVRRGYTLNGRLLRPAMVTVSTKKES
jgi:molecular chaperone GrpE